jgi:hypothetical protein
MEVDVVNAETKTRNVLTAAGCSPVMLFTREVWEWQRRWRAVFAKELHNSTGKWVFNDFDWHVFSFAHHEAKAGDAAWAEYRALAPCNFVVLSGESRVTFGFTCVGKPPDRLKPGLDVLVAATSLGWTMAFTHEESLCGPYFAEP